MEVTATGAAHTHAHGTTTATQATATGTMPAGGVAPAGGDSGHHGPELVAPPRNDPRFLAGTTGPVEKDGDAPTVKIPDGKGFGGVSGRKQNNDDKEQNNYSVTDANYNNQLGLLARDPDTGKELTYVQHIQMYNAAGYIANFAPETYARLVANQNAGKGTVLGAAAHLMGLVSTPDPAEEGVSGSDIPAQVPGSPIDARTYIRSGKDITGQNWARMHHPESAWQMYKGLVAAGVDWRTAMTLAGDDGVSGAGRVNGVNNQNGKDGFNGGEEEIWALGAQVQQRTGIPVIQLMMSGHNHATGQDASALTKPNINKLLGLDPNERAATPERVNAIYQALIDGKVADIDDAVKSGTEADNKAILGDLPGGTFEGLQALLQNRKAQEKLEQAQRNAAGVGTNPFLQAAQSAGVTPSADGAGAQAAPLGGGTAPLGGAALPPETVAATYAAGCGCGMAA